MKKDNDNPVIAQGISVTPGYVTGTVKVVKTTAEANNVKAGDIMVVLTSNPAYAIGVMNASGLICERGGVLTHICIVAREMGIPCLAKVEGATELLEENTTVILDSTRGVVYGKPKGNN